MQVVVVELTAGADFSTAQETVRAKYLTGGSSKKTQRKAGGNSGASGGYSNPPRGLRKHPRRKYG